MAKSLVSQRDIPRVLSLFLAYYKAEKYIHLALASVAGSEPKYAKEFIAASNDVNRNGSDLRVPLTEQKIFPQNVIEILHAGQQSGQLDVVVADLIRTTKQQNVLIKELYKNVSYQVVLLVALVVMTPYLLLNVAEGTANGSTVRQIAGVLQMVIDTVPGIYVLYPFAVVGAVAYAFISEPVRALVVSAVAEIPFIKNAVINYQTGIWCNYASIMFKAGLSLGDIERMLSPMVIKPLQEAFRKVIGIVVVSGWDNALTLNGESDPRRTIPAEARSFIRSGGASGELDVQLYEAASYLNERSTDQFAAITKVFGVVVLLVVAAGVLALALQVFSKGAM